MTWAQRDSGIFIRQNLLPQADIQAEHTFPEGQRVEPGIHQVLSYLTGYNAAGSKLIRADSNGNLLSFSSGGYETLPVPALVNLVAPRTDTTGVTLSGFTAPSFTVAIFKLRITAVSGTTPTFVLDIETSDSQGSFDSFLGGINSSSLNTVSSNTFVLSSSALTKSAGLGPAYRIRATIGGTTPSFTWYIDVTWK